MSRTPARSPAPQVQTHREFKVLTGPEAKQCYHCQGIGHVQSDCPSLRLARQVPNFPFHGLIA